MYIWETNDIGFVCFLLLLCCVVCWTVGVSEQCPALLWPRCDTAAEIRSAKMSVDFCMGTVELLLSEDFQTLRDENLSCLFLPLRASFHDRGPFSRSWDSLKLQGKFCFPGLNASGLSVCSSCACFCR